MKKMVFSYAGITGWDDDGETFRYVSPSQQDYSGYTYTLELPAKIALAIELARTVGCEKIVYPFQSDAICSIAKKIHKAYKDMGLSVNYQFPLKGE